MQPIEQNADFNIAIDKTRLENKLLRKIEPCFLVVQEIQNVVNIKCGNK